MSYVSELRAKIGHDEYIGVGTGVFIYKDGKVLLQRRSDNGCWSMHAGGLELGESVEDAARRELYEETGLMARKMCLLGVFSGEGMRYTYPNGDKVSIVQIVYVCEDFDGTIHAQADEVTQLVWFEADAMPENVSLPDQKAFAAFRAWVREKRAGAEAMQEENV